MADLILIRHGESEHHVKGLSGGWTDTPLTERGMRQAELVGRALASAGDGFTRFFSSDLKRAQQTAAAISEVTNFSPQYRPELRESNNGIAVDKTIAEAKALELPMTEPAIDWVPHAGAESWKDMSLRVMGFMDDEVTHDMAEPVVIVSHGNSLIAMVHWWLGLGEQHWPKISFNFEPASITRLTINRFGEKVIAKLNDTAHLARI